jgi:hypothetical protein
MFQLKPEEKLSLAVARSIIGGVKPSENDNIRFNEIDWDEFADIASFHEISSHVYPFLSSSDIPQEIIEGYKKIFYFNFARCNYFQREFLALSDAFEKAGISLIPIKGVAFLFDIYADNFTRQMCDIDVLIKKEDVLKARDFFIAQGYSMRSDGFTQEYWIYSQCHLQFLNERAQNKYQVDMHFGLDFDRHNRNILPDLWKRIKQKSVAGTAIHLLSPEDTLFSLALHLRRFGKVLNLKNTLDIALILNKYQDNIDWGYILKEAGRGRMRSTVFFALMQSKIFFNSDIPDKVWRDLDIPGYKRFLAEKLISDYTFQGKHKNIKRLYVRTFFLLFDNFIEPIRYVINIPLEQFAKYFGLKAYERKTGFYYRMRFFYIPYKWIRGCVYEKERS